MRAMILERISSLEQEDKPLRLVELPQPQPEPHEVLIKVSACGVCHTELDEIEGRTPPPQYPIVPGHEVVGRVVVCGSAVTRLQLHDRVGVGWIHHSSGASDENLSEQFTATGRDAQGGYAEFMTIGEQYAYPIPSVYSDAEAAPLLCAGAIGYRSLKLTGLTDGQALGLTGFGGSAHLVLQLTRHLFPNSPVSVFARNAEARAFATELGADWVGNTESRTPTPLHAIIDTTPAWTPIVHALQNLKAGGRLVINAIRKEDRDKAALLQLSYHDHLWMEREIKSVANITSADISEFLAIAAVVPIKPRVETYPLSDANRALIELKRGTVRGAKVLIINGD